MVQRRLAQGLGVDVQTASAQVRAQVNAAMAEQVRSRVEATGVPAADFTLFAFGGGGPLHACDIAEQVGIDRVVGFPHGSVFSAFGSSTVDVWHHYSRAVVLPAGGAQTAGVVARAVTELREQGRFDMQGEGFSHEEVTAVVSLVVERDAERHEVAVEDGQPLEQVLADAGTGRLTEVTLDLRAPMPTWVPLEAEAPPHIAQPQAHREVRWAVDAQPARTPVLRLEQLTPGAHIDGPAVIDTDDTVYAVNPGWSATVTGTGNVLLEYSRGAS